MCTLCDFTSNLRNEGVGQRLPKFHPPLVIARNAPEDALDKNAMLVHGDELALSLIHI